MSARFPLVIGLVTGLVIGLAQNLWAADDYYTNKQNFYKWIDEKGITHYSATPPSPKETAHKLRTVHTDLPSTKSAVDTTDATKTPTTTPATPTGTPKPLTTTTTNARPDLNLERDQSCQTAQKNLQLLKDKHRIYQKTAAGERRFLTDKEMEEQMKTMQQFLKDNC